MFTRYPDYPAWRAILSPQARGALAAVLAPLALAGGLTLAAHLAPTLGLDDPAGLPPAPAASVRDGEGSYLTLPPQYRDLGALRGEPAVAPAAQTPEHPDPTQMASSYLTLPPQYRNLDWMR